MLNIIINTPSPHTQYSYLTVAEYAFFLRFIMRLDSAKCQDGRNSVLYLNISPEPAATNLLIGRYKGDRKV